MALDEPPLVLEAPSLLIALRAVRHDAALLEAATQLASIAGATLRALLIEEPALAQIAGLPLTQEYDRRTGAPRNLDRSRVARNLRTRKRLTSDLLSRFAAAVSVSSSVHVAQGEYMHEALIAASKSDFALIDARAFDPFTALSLAERRWLLGRTTAGGAGTRRYAPIRALYDASAAAGRALALAGN
ncbi:MAG: hypothetical protein ACR2RL_19805, partial [Gammaproteobacteria bacterium]